jgi:hypothetical protein
MFIVRTVRRLLATKKDLDEQLARLAKDYQHAVKQPLTDESSDKMTSNQRKIPNNLTMHKLNSK